MSNKGFTYIELLAVLGISGIIAGTTAAVCTNTKDTAVNMIEDYAETYEKMDEAIENGEDYENTSPYTLQTK